MERRSKPDEKDIAGIDISLTHISQRLAHIDSILSKAPKDMIPNEANILPTQLVLPGQEKDGSKKT